jgi:predicted outer membrane repeat protein
MSSDLFRLLLALLLFPFVAQGTVVTTVTDEDNGSLGGGTGVSLREAVKYSPAGDTVTFTKALSGQTIRLTAGQITIANRLTIDSSSLAVPITVSGDKTGNGRTADDTRVFIINAGPTVLESLVISGASGADGGGGINCNPSTVDLAIRNCTFSGNYASSLGGGIYSVGILTIRNSTFTGNSCPDQGGALRVSGSATIENCTFSGNSSANGGAIYISGGAVSIQSVTVSGNSARTSGGGILKNSGSLASNNTIVAGNTAPAAPNISGTFTGTSNITSGNPGLAPLGNYGGPTQTMPPLPGSPAIDGGGTTILTTDQRGFPRVSTPDIGAAEYQGTSDLTRFWNRDFDGDGSPYGTEQALGTDPLISDPFSSRNITAPTLNASGHAVLSFGIGAAFPGTHWILKRSTDLLTFVEIYRYDGATDTAASDVTFLRTATGVTVTDRNPLTGGAFYRFEARLAP